MKAWITVLKAADAAATWHAHQRRKGSREEPYINHLLEVAMLVAEATGGERPDLVVAALLHDAIEDQEVPRAMIASAFGDRIAALVEELTDDKSQPKEVRKQHQIDAAPSKSAGAKLIKLADKTSNLRAIADSPPAGWTVRRRLDYIAWAEQVVAGLGEVDPWLEQQFREAVRRARLSVEPPP
jgi:(p)ppGpp synthase/HD superfamily hydrolase